MARAGLHVEHLPHGITRRPSGDARHRSETVQVGAVADAARFGLSRGRRLRERLAFLDAADGNVGDET